MYWPILYSHSTVGRENQVGLCPLYIYVNRQGKQFLWEVDGAGEGELKASEKGCVSRRCSDG